jgi:3-hydroxybutyrate dehydrogenase
MSPSGYGIVINIASVQGVVGSANEVPYVAAKHGLAGCQRCRVRCGRRGLRRLQGDGGQLDMSRMDQDADHRPQIRERSKAPGSDEATVIADLLSEMQLSDPAEIGGLALWLCAPVAHSLTGTAMR